MNHRHSALSSRANVFTDLILLLLRASVIESQRGQRCRNQTEKKKELTNVPEVRDNAWMSLAETFFGSGVGGHVSVW